MKMITVTERALLARINRKLRPSLHRVKVCREGSRWFIDLGKYYEVDLSRNHHLGSISDLRAYGHELGVLKPHEVLRQK